jgi:type IV pilus assembly protein PilB
MLTTHVPKRQTALGGLARQLVEEGLIQPEEALRIQVEAQRNEESFVACAVARHAAGAADLARVLARTFSIPLLDLHAIDMEHAPASAAPASAAPESLVRKHSALPIFHRGRTLYLAMADPTNLQALDEFRFNTGYRIEAVLVEQDKLEQAIESSFNPLDSAMASLDDVTQEQLANDPAIEVDAAGTDAADTEDAPIVRFVNKVLLDAVKCGASDIHFEPYEKSYRVRRREDGVLREVASLPASTRMRLSARLKVMSRLDLAERRVPQDGRIKLKLAPNREIDFRVSTCPTLHGEKIVLRILDPTSAQMGIDKLGYEDHQRALFEATIEKPYGMVLVTGPTGSGKTVSLYTALNLLNNDERNISTAEDPAEINLPGVNQVNVAPRIGLTFASCLRAFLRQDPDVIMVGEIRDLETAEIAIKAAQTGHMVLSTVHTNDAPQTLTRLGNMGVPAYNIASSVTLIIAQRLARRLCSHCKQQARIPEQALLEAGFAAAAIDQLTLYETDPNGCGHCTAGHRGRIGIYQVMPVTDAIRNIIMTGGNANDIEAQAKSESILDLYHAGLNKVRAGLISLTELNRVIVE